MHSAFNRVIFRSPPARQHQYMYGVDQIYELTLLEKCQVFFLLLATFLPKFLVILLLDFI